VHRVLREPGRIWLFGGNGYGIEGLKGGGDIDAVRGHEFPHQASP